MQRLILLVALWCSSACVKRVTTVDSSAACAAFETSVSAFNASLVRADDAPPRSDPERSPPLATAMLEAAERCLQARGVAVEKVTGALVLGDAAPVARELTQRTGGRAVYSAAFFLVKPYAAAAFDKATNTLFLPHSAVRFDAPDLALVHELQHVKSLQLLREHPRERHWLLKNASTAPDALSVDEIFAYAATSVAPTLDAQSQRRSLAMARQYANMVRAAVDDPTTVGWRETQAETSAHALDAETRSGLLQLLDCIDAGLPGIEPCDPE